MKMRNTKIDDLRTYVKKTGIVHARELKPLGIQRKYLERLCSEGSLVKSGRGLYTTRNAPASVHIAFAEVAKAIPRSVICLLSALRFHEIGTQLPYQVWIAIDRKSAYPQWKYREIRVMRFSGASLTEGIEEQDIAGVKVRIYNPAKTVADCFKYRNKIGLDVALEALRESVRKRKCTADELWRYANVCRVAKVMRPYMEAII